MPRAASRAAFVWLFAAAAHGAQMHVRLFDAPDRAHDPLAHLRKPAASD